MQMQAKMQAYNFSISFIFAFKMKNKIGEISMGCFKTQGLQAIFTPKDLYGKNRQIWGVGYRFKM